MCGIFGIIGDHESVDINPCLDLLKHRGPDDSGFFKDENVELGFRRLSIIDLSSHGNQPMSNEDSTVWVVFNGEIYNYLELKNQLLPRHTFRSDADTEVLIHGYEEWGLDKLLEKVNGMFAICLYDKKKQTSYLVRDRIGKKPLYYYKTQNSIAFSSETKAFFGLPNFCFEIDREMFDLFMGFSYLPDNTKTIIKNVYKVPPGCYVTLNSKGECSTKIYWDLPVKFRDIGFEQAKRELSDLLLDSVKRRLVADVPVGVLLSGGVDSSLITALAAKASSKQVTTINISFEDSYIDESSFADTVAAHCNTRHIRLRETVSGMYDMFKNSVDVFDDLSTVDSGLFSTMLLAKAVRKTGIKVVLVGEGADEIFGGYTWFQFANLPFSLLPSRARTWGYYYAIMRQLSLRMYLKYGNFIHDKMCEYPGGYFSKMQRFEIKESLPNHYCMKVDKGASAASVEARAPFMDYRVVEMASTLGHTKFLKDFLYRPWRSNDKFILREIAKDYLPRQIAERKKLGGMFPTDEILTFGIREDAELILEQEYLADYWGELNLNKIIESRPKNKLLKWQREWILWKSLVFSLWYEHYANYAKK